jgi:hypothetical protein
MSSEVKGIGLMNQRITIVISERARIKKFMPNIFFKIASFQVRIR